MEIPVEIIEKFFDEYVEMKSIVVALEGEPTPVDMHFILDFGSEFKRWPFFNASRIRDELGIDPDDHLGERLLAVAEIPNNREEITLYMARMMTHFGPPEWACVIADSYERIVSNEELEQLKRGIVRGDLEREYMENPFTDIKEIITADAVHVNGEHVAWRQRFYYSDEGRIVFEERERRDTPPAGGFFADLLRNVVELHGKEPWDILVLLAGGDEDEVKRMWRKYTTDMN